MANSFGRDILIQSPEPKEAARFYVEQLGFAVDAQTPELISLHGPAINLFIERGPALGPILEVMVNDVEAAKRRLAAQGCEIVKMSRNSRGVTSGTRSASSTISEPIPGLPISKLPLWGGPANYPGPSKVCAGARLLPPKRILP